MNNDLSLEKQINEDIKIFDRFQHPTVSADRARDLARLMAAHHTRTGIIRLVFQIGLPLAAAAGLALAAWLLVSSGSPVTTTGNGTETASLWSLDPAAQDQEKEMGKLFADLDFSTLATQPAATQGTDETGEEMDQYLLEFMSHS